MSLYFCHCEQYDDEELLLNSGLENSHAALIFFVNSCSFLLHIPFFFFRIRPFPTTLCNLSEVFIYPVYLSVQHSVVHTGRQKDMPR